MVMSPFGDFRIKTLSEEFQANTYNILFIFHFHQMKYKFGHKVIFKLDPFIFGNKFMQPPSMHCHCGSINNVMVSSLFLFCLSIWLTNKQILQQHPQSLYPYTRVYIHSPSQTHLAAATLSILSTPPSYQQCMCVCVKRNMLVAQGEKIRTSIETPHLPQF